MQQTTPEQGRITADITKSLTRFLDNPAIPWKKLIIGFSLGQFTFENWLLLRQYGVYSRKAIPKTLTKEVDQETFDKSQVRDLRRMRSMDQANKT